MEQKAEFTYLKTFWQSIADCFKEPMLLVPFVLTAVLGVIYMYINVATIGAEMETAQEIVTFLIILGLYLLLQIYFASVGIVAMKRYMKKESASMQHYFAEGVGLYPRFLGIFVMRILFVMVPLLVLMIPVLVLFGLAPSTVTVIIAILLGLIYIVFVIFYILYLMYAEIEASYGKKVFESLKSAFALSKTNMGHVLLTALSLLLFGIIVIAVYLILLFIVTWPNIASGNTAAVDASSNMISIVLQVIMIPFSAGATLYLFRSHAYLKPVKAESREEKRAEAIVRKRPGAKRR